MITHPIYKVHTHIRSARPAGKLRREASMALERWRPMGATVERWDPFRSISDIQSEMNRVFDSLFGRPTAVMAGPGGKMWAPVLDVCETKDDLILNFELPGVREKDVTLSITGDLLTVKGERGLNRDPKDESCHHVERVYGRFERTVQLPMPVQGEKVKATYRPGARQRGPLRPEHPGDP